MDASPIETSVKWTQTGNAIGAHERMEISEDGHELTIRHLGVADNGHYACVAGNTEGEGTCHSAYHLIVVCKYISHCCFCSFLVLVVLLWSLSRYSDIHVLFGSGQNIFSFLPEPECFPQKMRPLCRI